MVDPVSAKGDCGKVVNTSGKIVKLDFAYRDRVVCYQLAFFPRHHAVAVRPTELEGVLSAGTIVRTVMRGGWRPPRRSNRANTTSGLLEIGLRAWPVAECSMWLVWRKRR
jgi:hypothetical protein